MPSYIYAYFISEAIFEFFFQVGNENFVLRPLGSAHTRHNRAQVELINLRIGWLLLFGFFVVAKELDRFQVLFDVVNRLGVTARLYEILHRSSIGWKKANGSAVLWTHVGDGGSVSYR